jgi:hypothetical protein
MMKVSEEDMLFTIWLKYPVLEAESERRGQAFDGMAE